MQENEKSKILNIRTSSGMNKRHQNYTISETCIFIGLLKDKSKYLKHEDYLNYI